LRARESADRLLAQLRFSGAYFSPYSFQDESHQPPLYYLVTAPVFALASRVYAFPSTFLVTRLWSVAVASLVVPASFLLATAAFRQAALSEGVLLLVVLFPGLYPGVVRVSNDSLAVPLACFVFFFLIAFLKNNRPVYLYGLCGFVVAGLWTKAFFVPILCGVLLTLLIYARIRAAIAVLLLSALGWPWYFLNVLHSGSITGLPETVLARTSLQSSLSALRHLDWENLFNVARGTHIWVGNQSLLNVRGWMYMVIFLIFLFGVAGLTLRRRKPMHYAVLPLVVCYMVFCAALMYYATQVFQDTKSSVIEGWYLTSFIPLEAVLFVAGASHWSVRRWRGVVAGLAALLFLLLVYSSVFVALPYYSAITSHDASGVLRSYRPSLGDIWIMPARLLRLYPSVPTTIPWLILLAMIALSVYGIFRVLWPCQTQELGGVEMDRDHGEPVR
jgi:hypothetical protein